MKLSTLILLTTAATAVTPAFANDPIKIKPIIDARLRWEDVDQVGKANKADAVTARVRLGFEATLMPKITFLAESTATLAIDKDYYNATPNSKQPTGTYPTVADPQTIGLNRLQLQYKDKKTTFTVGRQRINLDDQRFVGSAGWRDNEQTFDAVRLETLLMKNLKADVTYAWKDNTIYGIDGVGANDGHVDGDNVFGSLAYTTKIGTLTGFGYVVNQDNAARVQFSSKTFGVRFAGKYAFSKKTSLAYTLSYANETDVKLNPKSFSANYFLGDLALSSQGFTLGGGYEVLGADTSAHVKLGGALTTVSFQTPLATLHKWNGWADKFLTTPATGLTDAYGSFGYTTLKVKPLTSLGAMVIYHDYSSDVASLHYGHEWDAQIVAKMKKYTFLIKYADFSTSSGVPKGITNTKKIWASLEWAF